tara:strand:+ start:233 stop:418 length:186 start_codon:yes stop_codon:yes gene_type:complete
LFTIKKINCEETIIKKKICVIAAKDENKTNKKKFNFIFLLSSSINLKKKITLKILNRNNNE